MERSVGSSSEISICTEQDYDRIIEELPNFWDGRDTRQLHHPMFINEFGNSAFVVRDEEVIVAYLFGFISQTAPVGYVTLLQCVHPRAEGVSRISSLNTSLHSPAPGTARTLSLLLRRRIPDR
jgi:hypothetical protein